MAKMGGTALLIVCVLVMLSPTQAYNKNLKYFSVWDLETASASELAGGWNNFLFTSANASQAVAYHAAGLGASLLNVEWTLFNATALWPDVDARWNALLQSTILPLLARGVLFGVFLGDELCWNCISYANLTYAATLVRGSLPADAIVYYNEAFPVFTDDAGCGFTGPKVGYTKVPDGVDWISIDYYPDEGTFAGARKIYTTLVYPKMAAHQSALWVPPAYGSPPAKADQLCCAGTTRDGPNPPCHGNCTAAMLDWARESYDWARSDPRMVGLTPWHYDTYNPGQDFNPGMAQMPAVLALWRAIGQQIVAGTQEDV